MKKGKSGCFRILTKKAAIVANKNRKPISIRILLIVRFYYIIICMDKEFLREVKVKLEAKRKNLEARLSANGTHFPDYGDDEESAVSEVEDYNTSVGLDNDLNKDLRATNLALERIERGKYGICLKCGKLIEQKRLEAYPAASLCLNCGK
jgi:RNA polymerase-binding transcription factor DksA